MEVDGTVVALDVGKELDKYIFRMSEISLGFAVAIIGAITITFFTGQTTAAYSRCLMLFGIVVLAISVLAAFFVLLFHIYALWRNPWYQVAVKGPLSLDEVKAAFLESQQKTGIKVRNVFVLIQVFLLFAGSIMTFASIW